MILENKEYRIKSSTKCDCGYDFTVKDMKELKRINQQGFYGNVVKHYGHAICPNCGKEVILLMKQAGQTYKVIDTASIDTIENENKTIETVENVEKEPNSNVEAKTENSNEIICPICGKACKSQLGYNSHMKTHQNN